MIKLSILIGNSATVWNAKLQREKFLLLEVAMKKITSEFTFYFSFTYCTDLIIFEYLTCTQTKTCALQGYGCPMWVILTAAILHLWCGSFLQGYWC